MPSQTTGLGDKGNPQVTKELDKLGNDYKENMIMKLKDFLIL